MGFLITDQQSKTIKLISYGTSRSTAPPPIADIHYSCKRFPNPYKHFPDHTGLNKVVKDWLLMQDDVLEFIGSITDYIQRISLNLKFKYQDQVVVVAFSCYGGRHRSVVIAEEVGARLRDRGFMVKVEHRELNIKK